MLAQYSIIYIKYIYKHYYYLFSLEDKRPIGRFLLALAKGPTGPLVKNVTPDERGANDALIVRFGMVFSPQSLTKVVPD